MNNPYLIDRAMPGGPMAPTVLPPDYNPADINPYAPGSKLNQGMFQPMMPMYQPQPTDGISSAVSQISGGMDDEYTNRLLGALGLGDVSQYQMQQPVLPPMSFYNPYMNPYAGMFSPFMQQPMMPQQSGGDNSAMVGATPYGGSQFGRDIGFGLYGMPGLPSLFGGLILDNEIDAMSRVYDTLPTTTGSSSFDPTGDGSDYDTSNTDSFDPTGDGSDYYS